MIIGNNINCLFAAEMAALTDISTYVLQVYEGQVSSFRPIILLYIVQLFNRYQGRPSGVQISSQRHPPGQLC